MEKIITTENAEKIYSEIKDLPIIDYHCHLSPKEIYENRIFGDLGEMWLAGDHYKWRLMRFYGIDEKYITGKETPMKEKYEKFVEAVSTAYGNPIQDWCALELDLVFGIKKRLCKENAEEIWNEANEKIKKDGLCPRKMFEMFNVEYVATTDDVCDSLEYHKLIREDKTLKTKVVPSFRVDKLVVFDENYPDYIQKLAAVSGIDIDSLDSFENAVRNRMDFFVQNGCKFSDVGIQGFPNIIAERKCAEEAFFKIINKKPLSADEAEGLQGYLFVFLGEEYAKRGMIMQLHLGAKRNSNTKMLETVGRDSGFDCVGSPLDINSVTNVLDKMYTDGNLPLTIVYTLNPTMYYELITMCGAFPGSVIGVPWWFCDHKKGIFELFETFSALGHIGSLFGMLTDSRSFLSYVRHDYFRMILSEYLGRFGDGKDVIETAKKISYFNAAGHILK
ncbi:MAG: glucuronate isomerase [Clostridia bacterium]|nr:glucuronate isomerase [Clostridia bacterium]